MLNFQSTRKLVFRTPIVPRTPTTLGSGINVVHQTLGTACHASPAQEWSTEGG
jgi:hypothetical protein